MFSVAYSSTYQCLMILDDASWHALFLLWSDDIFPVQVLRKNFRDLMYVCTFGEDETSERRVVYTDNNEDSILLMVRQFSCFLIKNCTCFTLDWMLHCCFLSIINLFFAPDCFYLLWRRLNDALLLVKLAHMFFFN